MFLRLSDSRVAIIPSVVGSLPRYSAFSPTSFKALTASLKKFIIFAMVHVDEAINFDFDSITLLKDGLRQTITSIQY